MTPPRRAARSAPTLEVWIVRPAAESPSQKEIATELRRKLDDAKIPFQELRCIDSPSHQGRKVNLLPPEVARELYTRCHRAHVCVAATTGAQFKLDPSRDADRGNTSPVSRLLTHKARYDLLTRVQELPAYIAALAPLVNEGWSGYNDPRCLPLHAFAPKRGHDLTLDSDREKFERERYHKVAPNPQRCWIDDESRQWIVDKAMHGRDDLHITGHELPTGFHWDVQTGRRLSILCNGWERWEATNGAHINVHPDAYVRSQHATRVWSWENPKKGTRGMTRREK